MRNIAESLKLSGVSTVENDGEDVLREMSSSYYLAGQINHTMGTCESSMTGMARPIPGRARQVPPIVRVKWRMYANAIGSVNRRRIVSNGTEV
jgi:hypothetical protein